MPTLPTEQSAFFAVAEVLEGLGLATCLFDADDCTVVWNRSFVRLFPEHDGQVHAGEHYRCNLRRFYSGRLGADELPHIERYVEAGLQRHRQQERPFDFEHRGHLLRVACLSLPGGHRARVWTDLGADPVRSTPATAGKPSPPISPTEADVFDCFGDGVVVLGADQRIAWVNQQMVQLFALPSRQAAVGATLAEVYQAAWLNSTPGEAGGRENHLPPTDLRALDEHQRFVGTPFELPLPGQRWVRLIAQRRKDGVRFCAVVDVTAFKRQQQELVAAEQRARASEARLAEQSRVLGATLELMQQGVMMVNAQRRVEVCNARAVELLGLPPALMQSRPSFEQVMQHQREAGEFDNASPELEAVLAAGGILNRLHAYERRRPNGQVIEISSVPVRGGGVLRTYTDVTERKNSERARLALEAQLRDAQRLETIGTLAGGIAHDFNNIVGAILGHAALACDAVPLAQPARRHLDQIAVAAHRARSLVQQILAFSGRHSPERESVSIGPLVQETVALMRPTVPADVQVRLCLDGPCMHVHANAGQLQQVLLNLGSNAVQALEGRAGHIDVGMARVSLGAADGWPATAGLQSGDHVHLWVRDDGCGMDERLRSRIFEPFFTTKPVGQGTGLGLAVVHGIIDAHGGAIRVDSTPGLGSTFHLYLPLAQAPLAAATAPALAPPAPMLPASLGRGEHVLYVDDDEVMAVMVQALLERQGYRVTCSSGADAAIALLAADPTGYDAAITDFNMPGRNGLELAQALRAIRPGLPLAISSGAITDDLRMGAAAVGVRHVVKKEHSLEALGPVLRALLDERAARGA